MIVPIGAGDPALCELQRQLLGVLQAQHIRTAPEGRGYRRADPGLLARYDAAARALAADPPADVEERLDVLRAELRDADGAASAAAVERPARSVTDLVDDPAKLFGTAEGLERGSGLHRHLRDFFAEGGGRSEERQAFEFHPLYGDATINAQIFLEQAGLVPLFVEAPLVGVGPDGREVYGTADLIAANAARGIVVVDWSTSAARPQKLVQVAGYMALLAWMWAGHRGGEGLPLGGGFVVGLGRDFDKELKTCVRQVSPRHVAEFIQTLERSTE